MGEFETNDYGLSDSPSAWQKRVQIVNIFDHLLMVRRIISDKQSNKKISKLKNPIESKATSYNMNHQNPSKSI